MANSSEHKRKGVSGLFTDEELKSLFKKFLILIGSVEILIFVLCWLYQLGLKEFDRYGTVNIPFPWKTYFLLSFLAPIAITFVLGILILAFNRYIYGIQFKKDDPDSKTPGALGKFQRFLHSILHIPFLLILLLLGIFAGIVYRIDDVMAGVRHLGQESAKFLLIILAAVLVVGTVLALVWMVLHYKLRKKDMEYAYKREVMERLGIAFTENNEIVNANGKPLALEEKTDAPITLLRAPKDADKASDASETDPSA